MGSYGTSADFVTSYNKKNEIASVAVDPRVLMQGWLCKKSERFFMLKDETYFVLLEDGRFLSFSTKPESNFSSAKPKQVLLMRSIPCLGLCKGLEDYRVTMDNDKENKPDSNNNNKQSHEGSYSRTRNTFTVQLDKKGQLVERTYCAKTAADRDEWKRAFAEMKELVSKKQKKICDFEVLSSLGAGYFGKVVLCREKSTGHPYAMKLIKKAMIANPKELSHTLSEKRFLQHLAHPFLVHMKYSFQTMDRLCFVTEYLIGGELYRLVYAAGHFNEKTTRFYAAEVVSAIGFLHQNKILYRDLKLENIMIDKDGHIRLVDFGLCKELLSAADKTRTFCGTRECMAPEALDHELYGLSVDWWGVGIAMYEMLFAHLPFSDSTVHGLFKAIMTSEVTFDRPLTLETKDILTSLLHKDPLLRLGSCGKDAIEIQQHPFFRDINWDDVTARKMQPPFVPDVTSDVDTKYFDNHVPTISLNSVMTDSEDSQLTSMERNKFGRISDYSEDSDG